MSTDEMPDFSEEFLEGDESLVDLGPARDGTFWVLTHNHTILGTADAPRPEGKNVGLRRYHSSLREGIAGWGKYVMATWKAEKASELVELVGRAEGSEFLECFYSFEGGAPGSYLAVVFTNSRRAGRVWLFKTVVHTLSQVNGTEHLDLKGKNIFTHHFSDFVDKSAPRFVEDRPRAVCRFTFIRVPLNGRCECGFTECEYSGAK